VAVIHVMVEYVASGRWKTESKDAAEHQAAATETPGA
jgi:phenylpyruvate tautomerase PptA (4-oxalocrotonate tautomerase family)